MDKYTAVVIGATGLIGHHVLELLLADDDCAAVKVLTRRSLQLSHPKLDEQMLDLQKEEELRLKIGEGDMIFCCIGTTQKKVKGNKQEYENIDLGIPVHVAQIAVENGFKQYLFVSSVGAKANSNNFYLSLKGRAEEAISKLPFQSVHIFRPSILLGKRHEHRAGEEAAKKMMRLFSGLFKGRYKKYRAIDGSDVAKAMVNAAKTGDTGVHLYEYQQIMEMKGTFLRT